MAKFASRRALVPVLAVIALAGFSSQLRAEDQCPELTRLRSEAAEAAKRIFGARVFGAPLPERCEAYVRISIAWAEAAQYASDHREACGLSEETLIELQTRHREVVQRRDNICAGRPGRPYPPDIIAR
jgi:hypothetical protein